MRVGMGVGWKGRSRGWWEGREVRGGCGCVGFGGEVVGWRSFEARWLGAGVCGRSEVWVGGRGERRAVRGKVWSCFGALVLLDGRLLSDKFLGWFGGANMLAKWCSRAMFTK